MLTTMQLQYTIFPWRLNNKSFTFIPLTYVGQPFLRIEICGLWCNINLFFVSIFKYLLYFLSLRWLCELTKTSIGDIKAKEGDLVNLLCSAQDEPPITFSWGKDQQKPLRNVLPPQLFPCCDIDTPNKSWGIYLSYPRLISKH
jgi:hypothetical protein